MPKTAGAIAGHQARRITKELLQKCNVVRTKN
jgi:hypothetical protein